MSTRDASGPPTGASGPPARPGRVRLARERVARQAGPRFRRHRRRHRALSLLLWLLTLLIVLIGLALLSGHARQALRLGDGPVHAPRAVAARVVHGPVRTAGTVR
jgi:hypothetical protein